MRGLILDSTTLAMSGIGSLLVLLCCWRRLLNLEEGTDGLLIFLCGIGVAEEEVEIGTVEELGHGLLNLSGMEMDEILEVRVGLVEDEGEDDGFGGTGSSWRITVSLWVSGAMTSNASQCLSMSVGGRGLSRLDRTIVTVTCFL